MPDNPSLLLDTHILLWWRQAETRRMRRGQVAALEKAERNGTPVAISAITLRELALAAARGRIVVGLPIAEWLEELESHPGVHILPITARIAASSVQLPAGFHSDPADQIIVATALVHGLRLLTLDDRIRAWGKVPVL